VATDSRGRERLRYITGAILIALVFSLFQALNYRDVVPSNDTYRYARQTLRIMGDSEATAVHDAVVMFCHEIGNSPSLEREVVAIATRDTGTTASGYDSCLYVYRDGLTPTAPRYVAIFTSRPGYPLLSVPAVAAFGLGPGMWLTALLCTVLASLLVLALLRGIGCDRLAALVGQALFLALPTGYWSSRMLTDGPSLAAALLALLGAWWLARGRIRSGAVVFGVGSVAGFVIRYSSETMLALALALAALFCLPLIPASRHRGTYWLAGLAGAAAIASQAMSSLLGWPGFSQSLQDTFTNHFARPDVSSPLSHLYHANLSLWRAFPTFSWYALLIPVGMVVGAVLLWRREPVFAVLVTAVALTGVGSVVAHPITSQTDRLIAPAWLLVVLGLPPLLARWDPTSGAGQPGTEPILAIGERTHT
jgi:hypothetical protein